MARVSDWTWSFPVGIGGPLPDEALRERMPGGGTFGILVEVIQNALPAPGGAGRGKAQERRASMRFIRASSRPRAMKAPGGRISSRKGG